MVSRRPVIGGPGSLLPALVESSLSWSLSCIAVLIVPGYHYCVSIYAVPLVTKIRNTLNFFATRTPVTNTGASKNEMKCWIPLTAHSRSELDRFTPLQRYHQLISMLRYNGLSFDGCISGDGKQTMLISEHSEKLVEILRKNYICRRLASLALRPTNKTESDAGDDIGKPGEKCNSSSHNLGLSSTSLIDHEPRLTLVHELSSIWPRLLELPPSPLSTTENEDENGASFQLTVVIPAYYESGEMLEKQILRLLNRCMDAEQIEIIVVDAGGRNVNNELLSVIENFHKNKSTNGTCRSDEEHSPHFGCVRLLEFTKGGGRGSCLNYGAAAARGRILTFCHLDTFLPPSWDEKIYNTLDMKYSTSRASACAFGFGIDTSPEGLSNGLPTTDDHHPYYPPGIKGVETTVNIRTQLYSLPYGDQAISIPKNIFDFLGGFPDQCLMEDYEFVALLRKRAALLETKPREALKIIQGPPAVCSARRWQKFGALYVTFMNSKLINLYSGGMGPDQLYELYYGRRPPERESELSPWEIEMEMLLKSKE